MKHWIAVILSGLILAGCSSPYTTIYEPVATPEEMSSAGLLPDGTNPAVIYTDDLDFDLKEAFSKNFFVIGQTDFLDNEKKGSFDGMFIPIQAKKVRALTALVETRYLFAKRYANPSEIPEYPKTPELTRGTLIQKNEIEKFHYAKEWYSHHVSYLGILKSGWTNYYGLVMNDLTPEQKQAIRRNYGVEVYVMMYQSPAYYADLFYGDIILKINNKNITSVDQAIAMLEKLGPNAKSFTVQILRDGKEKNMKVDLFP